MEEKRKGKEGAISSPKQSLCSPSTSDTSTATNHATIRETEEPENNSDPSPPSGSDNGGGFAFFRAMFFNGNRRYSFRRRRSKDVQESPSSTATDYSADCWTLPVPHLSPIAHTVISKCCRIIHLSAEDLYHCFDKELPDKVKQPSHCARNFIEFCSYQTIHLSTTSPDYLSDKEFRCLMFDMMLAWESSGVDSDLLVNETTSSDKHEEDEDGGSLFYSSSTNMAVQVDDKNTVGQEAFARIAPACSMVADIITVHNLFDVLTSSSHHRLHFLIFDKYLRSLEKGRDHIRCRWYSSHTTSSATYWNRCMAWAINFDQLCPLLWIWCRFI